VRYFVLFVFALVLVGCAGESTGPVQPAALTPEEEKAIMDRVNKNAGQEAGASPASAPSY
jgi:hypothetical protein